MASYNQQQSQPQTQYSNYAPSSDQGQVRYPPPPQRYTGGPYQQQQQPAYNPYEKQQQQQYPPPPTTTAQAYPAVQPYGYDTTGGSANPAYTTTSADKMGRSNGAAAQGGYAQLGNAPNGAYANANYQSTGLTSPKQSAQRPQVVPAGSGSSSSSPVPAGGYTDADVEDAELTEEERIEYEKGVITWEKAKHPSFWFRKEWAWYYVGLVFLIVIVALMAFFHHDIINWLTPFVRKLQTLTAGWLIPVAILFVLSFPPLFGNEIVMILVGVVWGLGVGFAIAAVGTILGEVANFFVFKFWCSGRAHRMTKKSLNYACLSQAICEGGWIMAIMVRLSAVPTHFTTVVFAVCGLKFWHFGIALIAGMPKQLLAVYVGVVLANNNGNKNNVVSDVVWAATAVISLVTLWYIYRAMLRVRKKVLLGMRHDLQNHHIKTSEPPVGGDEDAQRSWGAPFVQGAVTEPHTAGRSGR